MKNHEHRHVLDGFSSVPQIILAFHGPFFMCNSLFPQDRSNASRLLEHWRGSQRHPEMRRERQ